MSDVERATAITTFSEAPPPADEISDLDTRGFVQVVRVFVRTWPFLRPMVNGYWRQRTFARIGVGQRNTAWSFVHAPPLATIVTLMGPVTGLMPWGADLKLDLLLIATVAMAVLTWLILLSRNRVQAIAGVLLVLIGITANAAAVMAVTGYGDNLQVGLVTLACLSLWFVQYRRAEGRLQIRVRLGTHLVYYYGVVWLFVFIGLITALFSADILNQSLLIGKPLTPFVADLINRPDLGESEVRVPVKSDADPTTPQSTDGETTLSQEQRYELRWYYLILAIGLFVIGLHMMVLTYYNVWIMQAINQGLRNALLERWHRLSLRYHGDHRVGDSVYRIFQDSAQVTNVIAVVMRMAQTLIMYLMTLLFVTALDPVLGTLVLVVSGFALQRSRGHPLFEILAPI